MGRVPEHVSGGHRAARRTAQGNASMHVLRTEYRVAVTCAGPGWPDRAHDAISTSTSDASDGPPAARPPEPIKNIWTQRVRTPERSDAPRCAN